MLINKDKVEDLMLKLVSIRSPYFEEDEIMDKVQEWFKERNIPAFMHYYADEKVTGFHGKNVVVEICGTSEGPTIALNGHLDTVKLCNGWSKNPMGEIEGNRLYGQGALDMKSGCAAIMLAVEAFMVHKKDFKGRILVTLVSDEEGPYGLGTNALIEDKIFHDVDITIVTEPSAGFVGKSFPVVCLGARGGYGLDIEFYGKSAHAASPEKGINAITDAAKVIEELGNIKYKKDSFLGEGVCCVIAMEGDGGACSVPDFAKVKLFWHIIPGENMDTIRNEIRNAVKRANIRSEYDIKFREAPTEGSRGFLPFTVKKDESFVSEFIDSVTEIVGNQPEISYFNSIGDFCYLGTRVDAPAVIFGAAGENYHSSDEYVLLDSVKKTAEILYNYMEKMLT